MARPLSQTARQKAIDAAQAMVAELGITGFTVDGVARRSGVAKTTLYRHWHTGTALLAHALTCGADAPPPPDTGSLRGDLSELLGYAAAKMASDTGRRLFLELTTAAAQDPELATLSRALADERRRLAGQILSRAVARGEIPEPADPDLTCRLMEGLVLSELVDPGPPWDGPRIAALVELLVQAMGGGQAASSG